MSLDKSDFQIRLGRIEAGYQIRMANDDVAHPEEPAYVPFYRTHLFRSVAARLVITMLGFIAVSLVWFWSYGLALGMDQVFNSNLMVIFLGITAPFLALALTLAPGRVQQSNRHWPQGFAIFIWLILGAILSSLLLSNEAVLPILTGAEV